MTALNSAAELHSDRTLEFRHLLPTFDSVGSSAVTSAVGWAAGTLLGTFATAIAIVAIASVGFLMFTGRIDAHRAAQAVFGCFVIFGASTIAGGILGAISGRDSASELAQAAPPPPPLSSPPASVHLNSTAYNPYASPAYFPPR